MGEEWARDERNKAKKELTNQYIVSKTKGHHNIISNKKESHSKKETLNDHDRESNAFCSRQRSWR